MSGVAGEGQSESFVHYKKRVAACEAWERRVLAFGAAMKEYRVPLPGLSFALSSFVCSVAVLLI